MISLAAMALATGIVGGSTAFGQAYTPLVGDPLITNPGAAPKKRGWGGNINLGYQNINAESSSTNLNLELGLTYDTANWQNRVDLKTLYATNNHTTTAEQYFGAAQSDRLLNKRTYIFGYLSYQHTRFTGYIYQASEAFGYGRKILNTATQSFKAEIGAGYTQARTETPESRHSAVLRFRAAYGWQFSSNGAFGESFSIERSSFNTYSRSETKVTAQLVTNIAFVVSYSIAHNSSVPPGTPNTTTSTAVSVQYSFGQI